MSNSLVKSEETTPLPAGDSTAKFTNPSLHETYFVLAETMAHQATCPRKSVGCVLVNFHGNVVSTGWNGAPYLAPTCNQVGCLDEGGHCVRVVHAEIRALAYAAQAGVSLHDGRAYCTLLPCIQCMQALFLAGIRIIFYDEQYVREEKSHLFRLSKQLGMSLIERWRDG